MKQLITLFYFLFTTSLLSQPNKIEINEVDPLWHHTIIDSAYGTIEPYDTTTSFNKFNSSFPWNYLLEEDTLYILSYCKDDLGDGYGNIITKINAQTGAVLWETPINKWSGLPQQEIYSYIQIDNNGNLELLGALNPEKTYNPIPWLGGRRATPSKRIVDKKTGLVLDHIYDQTDTLGKSYPFHRDFHFDKRTNDVFHITLSPLSNIAEGNYILDFIKMDNNYALLEQNISDTVNLNLKPFSWSGGSKGLNMSFSLNDTTYMYARTFINYPNDQHEEQSELIYLDVSNPNNIRIRNRVNLLNYHQEEYESTAYNWYGLSPSGELWFTVGYKDKTTNELNYWFLWLDANGSEKVFIPSLTNSDMVPYVLFNNLYFTNEEVFIFATKRNTEQRDSEIIGIKKTGEVIKYSNFTADHIHDIKVTSVVTNSDDGKFYMSIFYDGFANVAAFDLRDFGVDIISSTEKITMPTAKTFKTFPNPTSDFINIEFEQSFTGDVYLINGIGQILRRTALNNSAFTRLNISELESGVWHILIKPYHGKANIKRIIKI